ncbi:hypothetical protein WN55_05061 [Dufourea novaeangliae]|uniref:Uncharacterized protein n=1 Tax=Dufourea novaeangliae TaxID=178035 RepID=A0A154PNS5_DUFNO|nr:hypothetical protein WN55_05061 [Dufourea novaeangliae]
MQGVFDVTGRMRGRCGNSLPFLPPRVSCVCHERVDTSDIAVKQGLTGDGRFYCAPTDLITNGGGYFTGVARLNMTGPFY